MLRPCFGAGATVGIEHPGREAEWRMYPNPADEEVWMDGLSTDGEIRIYDMTGKMVASAKGNRIETRGLANGVYVVRCEDGEKAVGIKKLIIKH